jgi:hypothetical protein
LSVGGWGWQPFPPNIPTASITPKYPTLIPSNSNEGYSSRVPSVSVPTAYSNNDNNNGDAASTGLSPAMVGVVCGVVALVIGIICVFFYYFYCYKGTRRKSHSSKSSTSVQPDKEEEEAGNGEGSLAYASIALDSSKLKSPNIMSESSQPSVSVALPFLVGEEVEELFCISESDSDGDSNKNGNDKVKFETNSNEQEDEDSIDSFVVIAPQRKVVLILESSEED